MNKPTIKQQLQKMIVKGELEDALKALQKIATEIKSKNIEIQITSLFSRFNRLKTEKRKGTIEAQDASIEQNQIVSAILELSEEIDSEYGSKLALNISENEPSQASGNTKNNGDASSEIKLSFTKRKWWQWVLALAVFIGILEGIAQVSGYSLRDFLGCSSPNKNLQLTVYVHGSKGKQDIILENEGKLIADFGNDRRDPMVGENGRANMGEIPQSFHSKKIPISLQAEGYETLYPDSNYLMNGEPIYLAVKPNCANCRVYGNVRKEDRFSSGLIVNLTGQNLIDTTDQNGFFEFNILPKNSLIEYPLTILSDGQIIWDSYVTPNQKIPTEIILKPEQEYCLTCTARNSFGQIVNQKRKCSADKIYLKDYKSGFIKASLEQDRKVVCNWNNQ